MKYIKYMEISHATYKNLFNVYIGDPDFKYNCLTSANESIYQITIPSDDKQENNYIIVSYYKRYNIKIDLNERYNIVLQLLSEEGKIYKEYKYNNIKVIYKSENTYNYAVNNENELITVIFQI